MSERLQALQPLAALAGEWQTEAVVQGRSIGPGRVVFEWLEGAFLVQHAEAGEMVDAPPGWAENSPFPVTTIIGLDASRNAYSMLYADARGVLRIYEMSLEGGAWRMWRHGPEFSQRFEGIFSEDGDTITAHWDMSENGGASWQRDFDLIYRRISR